MDAAVIVGEKRDIGAEHDERAVQDIDDVQDTPDQRKADCDAGIKPAQHKAVRQYLRIDHDRLLADARKHCLSAKEDAAEHAAASVSAATCR